MLKYLFRKYITWKRAKQESYKRYNSGTLLNAFHETQTIFIHIPKTAGISIINAIYGDVSLSGHRSYYFNTVALDIQFRNTYFSFAFVRNPFERLYSSYLFLKNGGINKHDQKAYETYISKYNDFEDFILNGLNNKIIYEITHFIPQVDYLCDFKNNILVDFVGRFEKLDEDIRVLSKKLNMKINLDHLNFNEKKDYQLVYTKKMIEIVSNLYSKDLEIFNYKF
ncbi:MAG: sulfotransferase family 2 domain-containing protein [Flavobacteriales bacterium]|nr:sulfotransferase family 2 domain-containing protein [Flavobacteriales bacterium]